MTLLTLLLPSICLADVTVSNDGDIYTLQNAHARIEVDASAGARIRSWVLIPSERDLIAVWNGANEIGGALDDRAFFTAMRYRPAIMHPGPDSGELRLEASHPSGLAVAKRLILHRDSPALSVLYEWRNGTQSPRRLFVRNFFLPGHKPQDDQHLYWVNATPDAVEGSPEASNYYVPADPPYSAMWDSETGDGIAALVPGVDKFYFWRGSKEFPTFEWLHEDVQAGKVLHASVLLRAVEGDEEAPDWPALLADPPPEIKTARLTDLAGWKDEAALFAVTDDEREKGFWLSVGEGDGKQRLPESIEIDVPAGEHRYIGVTINALEDFAAPVEFRAPKGVAAYWQTLGEDRRELLLLPEEPVQFTDGGRETLWLRVGGAKGATYDATLMIGDVATNIPIRLRAWEVDLTQARPFHLRGYCGGFTTWTGGYTVDEAKLPRLNGILTAFAEMGGDVLDWNTHWAGFMPGVKLAETGEWLAEVAKANPERIDLNDLPDLDFTHFDPWLEAFKDHGVTRVDTHMMHPGNASLSWRLFGPAIGADRVEAGAPEAERVLVWWFTQMR
ncbi:MAG TPA: hypothetical protein QGH10_20025, partial [Armatimonadota bacterium]|nr:hypothetical protein [Armatimonadota bacterium]